MNIKQYGGLVFGPEHYEAMAWVESRHKPDQLTNKTNTNALGPLQLTKPAFKDLQSWGYFSNRNFEDLQPYEALAASIRYSSELAKNYGFYDKLWNVAAYNMGPTKARELYKAYDGDLKKAMQDSSFPQTTRNYIFDYNGASMLGSRKAKTTYIKDMYDILQNNKPLTTYDTKKYSTETPTSGTTPLKQYGGSIASVFRTNGDSTNIEKSTNLLTQFLNHKNSTAENITEVLDPSGITSYDDVYQEYKKSGLSPETLLEVIGALPLLGKIGKLTQAGIHIKKYAGVDKAIYEGLKNNKKLANITAKSYNIVGKSSDAIQAYESYKNNKPNTSTFTQIEKYQSGGENIDIQKLDSILNANKNLEWVQRLYDINAPSIHLPGEKYPSTHLMASTDNLAFPTIIKQEDGTLKYLGFDKAFDYALKNKSYIEFPTEGQAIWFANNGYKKATGINKDFQKDTNMKKKIYQLGGLADLIKASGTNDLNSLVNRNRYKTPKAQTGFEAEMLMGLAGGGGQGGGDKAPMGPFGGVALGASTLISLLPALIGWAGAKASSKELKYSQEQADMAANTVTPGYQTGGGYRNDSPDVNNKVNVINSPSISMENVSKVLKAFSFSGDKLLEQRIMKPGEEHFFPFADKVIEFPLTREAVGKMQLGGDTASAVPTEGSVPVQARKGESIIHANGDVTEVAANKTHQQYKRNDITDTIIPSSVDEQGNKLPGSYIVSEDKRLAISKDFAKDISTGITPAFYSEGSGSVPAKETNLADEFFGNRSKMTPTELLKSVLKKYKMSDRDASTDPFAAEANQRNKEGRKPYLEVVKALNDLKRGELNAQNSNEGGVPQAQLGGGFDLSKELSQLEGLYSNQQKPSALPGMLEGLGNVLGASTAALFTAAQNPVSKIHTTSPETINKMFQHKNLAAVDQVFSNSQATKDSAIITNLERLGVSPNKSVFYLSQGINNDRKNQAMLSAIDANESLDRNKAAFEDKNIASTTQQINSNIQSRNHYLGNLGSAIAKALGIGFSTAAGVQREQQNADMLNIKNQSELLQMKMLLKMLTPKLGK